MTDLDSIVKEISDIHQFIQKRVDEGSQPLKEEQIKLAEGLKKAQADISAMQKERIARVSDFGSIRVPTGRFAGYDMFDLRILEKLLLARMQAGKGDYSAVIESIRSSRGELRSYMTPESILAWQDRAVSKRKAGFNQEPRGVEVFKTAAIGWTRSMIDAYHKALDSTTAGKGDELVPTFEAAELWLDVNLDTLILPLLPQMTMPTNPFDIPIQFGDTNWYPASENVQVTTTDVATQKVTLTAYGLKTGVPFSDELEEDAVVALVPELRASLVRNASEVIDDVLLNADTTTTNGINSDGAAITTASAGKGHWLLGFNGLVHAGIVDASSTMSSDHAGAAPTAAMFSDIMAKMGRFAVPRRRGDVVFVTDVNNALKCLQINELETIDVAGLRATMSTGEILNVYGKPLIYSEQMRQADADGKVTDAGNSTNTGRVLCFNSTQWKVGFRRQISLETDREPGKGQTTLYVSFRIALTERSGTRSTQTHTGIVYNILR